MMAGAPPRVRTHNTPCDLIDLRLLKILGGRRGPNLDPDLGKVVLYH